MRTPFFLLLLLSVLPASSADLRAGRAGVKITPPLGMPMAGYYYVRLNEGTHDDLFAKALVIEKDGAKAAMVALDLVGVPRPIVEAAREAIGKTTSVPPANVMISATHSHTGPEMGSRLRGVDAKTEKLAQDYLASLPGLIAESVRKAEADLQPVRVRAALGKEREVSFIRRYFMKDGTVGWNPGKRNPKIVGPVGTIDPDLPIVLFESTSGKPLALYVNFACHLDTVGGMQFSADYAYTIGRLLSEIKGPDLLTIFTIGTAGNINHIDTSSAEPQKGHVEGERIGAILTGDILKAWRHLEPIDPGTLHVASTTVPLPLAHYSPTEVERARQIVAAYGKPNASPFLEQVNAFKVLELEERHGQPIQAEVQVITLGEQLAWVGMPGEIFVEHGKALKIASPFPRTVIAELANGSIGYVPDRQAYPQGAYEVVSSRVAPGGGEMMVEAAAKMLIEARKAH
jgi:hypothetical protein